MTNDGDVLCPEPYRSNEACYAYFNKIFNDFRYGFTKYNDNGLKDKFDKIDDPILRHIALYLIENYHEAEEYFSIDGKWQHNPACVSLNKWLDNKKSYFTHALHCKGNVKLWDKTIEPLWNVLESKNNSNNNGNNNKSCKRNNFFRGELHLPEELNPPTCYKHVAKGYECVLPFPPNMCNLENTCKNNKVKSYYEKCKNINGNDFTDFSSMFDKAITNGISLFKDIDDVTFSRQVQSHSCTSFEYATPISFTPIGSKMSYKSINKKRLRDNFNEELEYEEYARSMNKNSHRGRKKNNIYYHSVKN